MPIGAAALGPRHAAFGAAALGRLEELFAKEGGSAGGLGTEE